MKKLFLLVLGIVILMASMVFAASASEMGWSFAENEFWEVEVAFDDIPTSYEARIYLTDNSVTSVVMGNYARKYEKGMDLRVTAGGIPTLVINTGGTDTITTSAVFEDAVIPLNTWTNIKVELDLTGLCVRCYINGELKGTFEILETAIPEKCDSNIIIGGDRAMKDDGTHNAAYFRGYIESAAAYVGEKVLFSYDYNGEGNTEKLMKDQSSAGNDANFAKAWLETSGIEESGEEYAYRFAVVGDPQTISQAINYQSYLNMYTWIAEQKPDFVMTLGDIIQSGASHENELATGQWLVATEALGYLDAAGVPHSDVRGNHCTRQQYDKYITYDKYYNAFAEQGVTTICHEESMINSAHLFEVSGVKYMIFALEYGPSESVLGWAGRLCEQYYDYNVIVTTHSYLGRSGKILGHEDPGDAIEGSGFTTGQEDWDWLIDKYPNIVLVICGHISTDTVIVSTKVNSCGTVIPQILIDFQSTDSKIDNNVGMVNMFNFTEDGKTLFIETYSTAQGLYYRGTNQIKLSIDAVEAENDYAPDYGTKSAEGTVCGYNYALYGDTLVISGKGSGVLSGTAPAALASAVKTVVIENDTEINTIEASFFASYNAVETLVLPDMLKTIGSKTFAGMSGLNTVAYFNDYYSDSFAGEGIIDIRSIQFLANDSFEGSAANASTVYVSRFAEISGNAKALVAGDAVYYTYPSGSAAQYMRSLGATVKHSYYTEEMTGDKYLALSGTAYRNGKNTSVSTLNWSFDIETETLSITQGNGNSIRMHGEGLEFENFKATWNDLIKTLNMGSAKYSQWESWEGTNSVPFGLTELENIVFAKKLDIDDKTIETGWFEGCTNLKNMKLASATALEDGIIDLSWWQRLRGDILDRMFKDCVSIKEVIFPDTMILNNDTLTFRICKGMFENCVNLERLTIPSYAVSIEANAFKGCENLETITIEATGFTVEDKSAFPDKDMTIYVLSPEDKATITSLGYENIKVVCLANGTMESGYTWSISEDGQLTIGGSGNGKIEFSSVPTADDLSAISWNAFLNEITSVVIEESTGITGAVAYALSNMPNCTSITLPTTFGDFTTDGLFAGNTSLTAITQQGTEPTEGVIDLRGATAIKATAFANIPAVIWIGKVDGAEIDFAGMGKTDAITFVSYPTCDAADDVRAYIKSSGNKNVKLTYYSEEFDATLTREGTSLNGDGTNVGFAWSFDDESGKLTIDIKLASSRYQTTTAFLADWKPVWADAVYEIYVTGAITKLQYHTGAHGIFDSYDNLRKIHFVDTAFELQNNTFETYGFFSYNPSLTTLGSGSGEIEEGVVDISLINNYKAATHMQNLLNGCSSITSVKFRETAPKNISSVVANMFKDCTSLVAIQIPAYATAIEAGAFEGCTNLKTITLMGDTVPTDLSGIPDKEGLRVICKTEELSESVSAAGKWTNTNAISVSGAFSTPTSMNGFSIRLKDYNGLRSMFSFDEKINEQNEEAGYTLIEYGAIAMSEAAYNTVGGPKLTPDSGTYAVNVGKKVRVYSSADGFIDDNGNATLHSINNDSVRFNVAVVRYTSNHASNIYMCAYSIYMSPTGEEVITYSHYSDDYKFFNLYDITLEMYKAGAINASVSDDAAVWNTLLTGAVTIESGDRYAEIPAVGRTDSGVYTPSKTVTITLVLDTDDTSFVAIYRGTGAIPAQHDSYSNGYGGTSANQLGPTISTYSPAAGYDAIPILSADEVKLVKTIIMDHGITSMSKYAFVGLDYAEVYVYPTSLTSINVATFFYNTGITTAYCAHVDDPNKENEIGLLDFGGLSGNWELVSALRHAINVKKVHFPGKVTKAHGADTFGTNGQYATMAYTKMWFGSNPEPMDGVVDMSNITVSAIGKNAFMSAYNITTLILPNGCESIDATAFNGASKTADAGKVMSQFKTVMQPTYHAGVAEYCAANGLSYVDYNGNELKAQ